MLFLEIIDGAKFSKDTKESPVGFRGVDVEGVTLGESPTAETMMRGMPDYSASTGSLGSGTYTALYCEFVQPPFSLFSI